MLYHLALWMRDFTTIPGIGVFQYVTFRAAVAAVLALLIAILVGPKLIALLKRIQIGEQAKRELQGVGHHSTKAGTPTMGGIIVLAAVLIPTLLLGRVDNMYVITVVATTGLLGIVGFTDDYLKVVRKLPNGLIGKYKLLGQVVVSLMVGCALTFMPEWFSSSLRDVSSLTTVPFEKMVNFDFGWFYIPMVVFVITATSNAVNLTDGLDGLCIGTVGISALALAVIAYFSGNAFFADYLNIMHLRGTDELVIFCAAIVGASMGFLWYNAYPAQVFMGDTGSLALGGAIGVLCVLIKKEFLLPILGGIFFAETVSVILQVTWYKYTRRRYGEGRRLFLMAPLHHHFEKKGWHESKIVTRFYIIAVMLAIITMATFKVR
ncbi:MAG: phospho-N-acetylmuramoyl-pentapeptide-transferase [Chlorobi bacterium]|nr:MAG: phospho-N-acetylmuramoyl-pentapeptide-transferase [Bacteroidota bacterium]KXK34611.1 MAG: UDP-N-acetylmuramyl pentapeptide phosphotransferase [Chlorobi bacterium OLB6]MBE2265925.1 phospho-N-acetylmuramoyl-pentapeptide-transferase [Flavobacteriales bacterium]MBL1160914.1 phospho-N-acetylmuramoyl-pentapeptide-transferase [Chlorobiota bacterium]MBW7852875.1 phospho-N-acetylmuramoyl-pentapeptide-transferase [Candidatus Kapabacteria bacterium]MCC6330894.1 phospho-N-acetylmuramoyl-pentapepti